MALKSATTTLATIQMRRGREEDFDPDQMTEGEWAVSTDSKKVWMCFVPGLVLRMATYEAFEKDMEEIRQILVEAQDIEAAITLWCKLAESYAHGGTGTREGEDTDNAKYYADQAKISADNVEAMAGVGIMTTEKAGIGKPDGTSITVDADGTMHSFGGGGASGDFASKAIYGDNAISLGRNADSEKAERSITYGYDLKATKKAAIALGESNEASGGCAVAVGFKNLSMGNDSVAIGAYNAAIDNYSFSEGCGNIVLGYGSHVEGCQNVAGAKWVFKIANYDAAAKTFTFDDTYTGFSDSFANLEIGSKLFIQNVKYINSSSIYTVSAKGEDGKSVTVNEDIPISNYLVLYATLIKNGTENYDGIHTEGRKNIVLNNYAHAEGYTTEALGYCSHTEGNATKATANQAHAEGYNTQATGEQSHAEGNSTVAGGACSHAGGTGTITNEKDSFCHGTCNVARGFKGAAFAEGYKNFACGDGSHAEGYTNITSGTYILKIEGYDKDSGKLTFDDTHIFFKKSFEILKTGEKLFIQRAVPGEKNPLFTISSIGDDGKSVFLKEKSMFFPSSDTTLYYAVPYVTPINIYAVRGIHAEGDVTVSIGSGCHSEGTETVAIGYGAHAEGNRTTAQGILYNGSYYFTSCSHAEGNGTIASVNQHAQGHYNDETKSGNTSNNGATSGTAFVIGNGTAENGRSNAARIDYNGKLWCKQAYSSTGADYAELFEWADGNPENEDRRGYFVTVDGKKIKKASEGDYIVGIISGNPSVIGNTDMEWYGQFMRDEFGTFIKEMHKEMVKEPSIDEDGNMTEVEREVDVEFYKVNPDYDPDAPYTFRLDRPEWDAVGMLGVLPVRDDGTCEVGKFCRCADGGIATLATERGFDTYMVIERVSENVVSVVLK